MRDGWTETTLGDVADVNMGQSPPGDTYNAEGIGMPFMQGSAEFGEHYPEPVKFCSAPAKIAEIGDLLLSVRAPVGDSNFANQRIAIGRGLATVRAKREADTNFLRLVIQLNTAGLLATSGTGMFSSITGKNLREFGVNLPPLAEQKRIVDVVSSVDAYIDALQQQAGTALKARNAVLHELLSAGGDDWTDTTLGDIAEVVGGGTPSTAKEEFWDGDVIWLTPTEVTAIDGKVISESKRKITQAGLRSSGARILPRGTVILTSRASVGFVALAGTELTTNQGFQSLIPSELVDGVFLMFWIQMNRSEFQSRSAGSTFKEISKSNVKSVAMNLPPLVEQKRIVEIVSAMDDVIQSTEQAVLDAKNLRSGLLSDLLSGEHEIPASYDSFLGAA